MERLRDFILGLAALGTTFFHGGSIDKVGPTPTAGKTEITRHEKFHYPIIDGKKTEAVPYLTLPFRKADIVKKGQNTPPYSITEGWTYSAEELKISKADPLHAAVDFHVPYGTPVVAPADGYAVSSYFTYKVTDKDDKQVEYQGKPLHMGLGYFVRIYVPSVNRVIEMGHLSDIDEAIPFSPPIRSEYGWEPTNHRMSFDEWVNSPAAVFVKKGTVLGKTGYSGLTWGYDDYVAGATRPVVIDPAVNKSWDEPHIHFEEFYFHQVTNEMGWQRDPFAVYDTYDKYPAPGNSNKMGKDPLFLLNAQGQPKYADE